MAATSFEIKENHPFSPKKSETDVYHTELNIVSWFGKEPKLDIRGWFDDHEKMTKGISLTEDDFSKIARTGLEKLGREIILQITFNSSREMRWISGKNSGACVAKEEKAVITAEEMKQHSVSESCQSIPVSAPARMCHPYLRRLLRLHLYRLRPTSRHEYTRDDLARAAMTLMDKGGMVQLQQLLTSYGCETLQQLTEDQFGSFATSLQGNGGADLMGHEERDHALLSASSAHRWLKCSEVLDWKNSFRILPRKRQRKVHWRMNLLN